MIDLDKAKSIIKQKLPQGQIKAVVSYKNLYVFQVFRKSPGEEEMDPFYSVDQESGEFKEFSVLTDANTSDIITLFKNAK